MECGKLTAKLRDAVPVCFMVNDHEVKRYKNIEIPEEIKHLEYCGFRFDVSENGAITFKIWFNAGILPEVWPAERGKMCRSKNDGGKAQKEKQVPATVELRCGVTGPDRKTMVAVISTIIGVDAEFMGVPSLAYKIGEYLVEREGTVTGPANPDLIAALTAKGFTVKYEGQEGT